METNVFEAIGINHFYLLGQIVNFTILLLVLKKFIYQPILRKLEERSKQTQKSLETAEEIAKKQEKWEEKQAQEMQKVQTQTQKILEEAQKQAQQEKSKLIKEAKQQAQVIAQAEYSKFEKKLKDQEKKLQEKTSQLIIQTTKKTLSAYLDKKAQTAILKKQLQRLKEIKVQ